jgi:small subunit ribosomal protein S2
MASIDQKAMLEAGVHFGHLKKKWNPKMLPYIFAEKKGIHVIDLNKTASKLEEAGNVVRNMAKNDKTILFVATKKQAKDIVKKAALSCEQPYVVERWLGGMLTNFTTIRKSVRKMQNIDKMFKDGTVNSITKKERLMLSRQKDKLEKVLGGIANLNRVPHAIFVVDILHEDIAISECKRLGISTIGMVDTNSDPNKVNFAIPANDDNSKSIEYIANYLAECIREGAKEKGLNKEETPEGPQVRDGVSASAPEAVYEVPAVDVVIEEPQVVAAPAVEVAPEVTEESATEESSEEKA